MLRIPGNREQKILYESLKGADEETPIPRQATLMIEAQHPVVTAYTIDLWIDTPDTGVMDVMLLQMWPRMYRVSFRPGANGVF